jgi:hypothetical protein
MNRILGVGLLGIVVAALGCGGSKSQGEDSATQGALAIEAEEDLQTVKLFEDLETRAARDCQLYTELRFGFAESGTATLETKIDGFCELPVPADRRSYPVRRTLSNRCGGRTYESNIVRDGLAATLRIVDNREPARACTQVVPRVEVEESHDGAIVKLASATQPPSP